MSASLTMTKALTGSIALGLTVCTALVLLKEQGVVIAVGNELDLIEKPIVSASTGKCRLTLVLPKVIRRRETSSPDIRARITNVDQKTVTLVLPGDGSEVAWRTPITGWSVLPVDSNKSHPASPNFEHLLLRCGNKNEITDDEAFLLLPGESKEFSDWIDFPYILTPGKYRVVFYYTNDPTLMWPQKSLGLYDLQTLKKIKLSTSVSLVSNEVVVEVVP